MKQNLNTVFQNVRIPTGGCAWLRGLTCSNQTPKDGWSYWREPAAMAAPAAASRSAPRQCVLEGSLQHLKDLGREFLLAAGPLIGMDASLDLTEKPTP
mmetsp:Transcript_2558/g.6438  ORF Transcript_2558/g.6438 Transcript_2558/m.6438 type:complete len:98 (+) Transcript_2558:1-294(+)